MNEYSYYEEYIERMAKGEKNILTKDKIEYFGHTSGTSGKQKLIPSTKANRKVASKYMGVLTNKFCYNNFKNKWTYGKGLMLSDLVMTTYTEGGIPICSATSGGMNSIKFIIPYLYTSPLEVMYIKDKETAFYIHLLFALNEPNLMHISAVFISSILDLFRTLESRHEELVKDIRTGKIPQNRKLNIDEETRKSLNKLLESNPSRARKLENEFQKGFKGISTRIWPRLAYIATVTGSNFSIYDDKVRYYTDSVDIYSPAYAATEAMIGINPYSDKIRYVIIPDTAFYEFICYGCNKEDSTHMLNELEIGKEYEIVITNHAGLYRYRIGDIIRVVGFYNNSPEVEFVCRKNQLLNMVAEKTNEEQLRVAIERTMETLGLNLVDYTASADNEVTPGRYNIYIEIENAINKDKIEELEDLLDIELKKSNLAYGRARNSKRLGKIKISILKKGTFNLAKKTLIDKGISKNQIKIPRVIDRKSSIFNVVEKNIA